MVTLKEIAISINAKLKEVFPTVVINTKDITEGFARPSFTVDFDNATKSPFGTHGVERNVHVIIYFFPTDRYQFKIEMLETQEQLEDAFNHTLTIKNGFVAFIDETVSNKSDGVLQFAFDVPYIEINDSDLVDGNQELMENLNLTIERV